MLFEDHAGVVQFVFVVIGNDASTLVACIFTAYVCNHFPVWVETTTYAWCWFNFHYISKAAKVFKGGGNSKRKGFNSFPSFQPELVYALILGSLTCLHQCDFACIFVT